MKILSGLLLFVLLGLSANGQQGTNAKVIAEISASSDKVVKGSPFSAEAVSESVQVLADGNRIVRSSTSKLYRNTEGRFRRELSGGSGDLFGSVYSFGQGISILDPVIGHRYLLDSNLKTARVIELKSKLATTVAGKLLAEASDKALATATQKALAEKLALQAKGGSEVVVATGDYAKTLTGSAAAYGDYAKALNGTIVSASGGFAYSIGGHAKYESRTEQLGTQNIEGVNAEGTRTVTTIPAGAIGNERPIEMVYEKWYSPELDLVVLSKNSDPRFGEQTYRLTNIVRSEPESSLFTLPTGYKVLSGTGQGFLFTTKVEAEKAATPVEKTKP